MTCITASAAAFSSLLEMTIMRILLTLITLLALTTAANAATLSKLPDILQNTNQPVTTDSLNRALLDLMHQRENVHQEVDLDKLAPAAGSQSGKTDQAEKSIISSYPSPTE